MHLGVGVFFANIFICLRDEALMPLLLWQLNHVAAARNYKHCKQRTITSVSLEAASTTNNSDRQFIKYNSQL